MSATVGSPDRACDPSGGRAADGLLHRHDGVHRLQGVRGRLQAVERPAGRRLAVQEGRLLRPHRRAVGLDVAARAVRRAARALGGAPRAGRGGARRRGRRRGSDLPATGGGDGTVDVAQAVADMDRWIFMSDVCKHCTNAGCLDACPTGALIRTEFQTVLLQPDVCNGCGYCIPACPFGVVDRDHLDGRAGKCTLCYDRLEDGLEPACAKACPTDSIQFGPYEELVAHAERRVADAAPARRGGRVPLRRRRRARARPRRRPRGVLPADRATRALRPTRRGRVAGPGERRRRDGRGGRRRAARGGRRRGGVRDRTEEPVSGDDAGRATSRRRWARRASRPRGGRRPSGEHVALARPAWGDAGWSFLYGPDTRYGDVEPEEGEVAAANRRMRDGAMPGRPARAVHQAAGVDVGGAALLLGRRHRLGVGVRRAGRRSRGRRVVGRGRAQGRARRGAAGAGAADRGPRPPGALPEHAAHLQAALADEPGRVVPGRVQRRRRRRRRGRPARAAPDGAEGWARVNALLGGYLGSYTGVLLAATAVPVWARSRIFLGPIFVSTATATGAAATRLTLAAAGRGPRTTRPASRSTAWRPARCSPS